MPTEPTGPDDYLSAILSTALSQQQVAQLYRAPEWRVRKHSWFEYEVRCPWAELCLEGEGDILMHGPVTNSGVHAEQILAPLRAAGIRFKAEFYDSQGTLVREVVG
jgi:hypothetical protein